MRIKIWTFLFLFLIINFSFGVRAEIINNFTLEEKIAQMIMVNPEDYDSRIINLGIGGIFLNGNKTSDEFMAIIQNYTNQTKIKLFIATDLEGYIDPFSDYESIPLSEIKNGKDARALGIEHARKLKEVGFNMDFSPVVESKDTLSLKRTFSNSYVKNRMKIKLYIKALQNGGIISTAKHYPGGNLIRDTHRRIVHNSLNYGDLKSFDYAISAGVDAIMVGHTIVSEETNSEGIPSSMSPKIISKLRRKFSGLIITDDINMRGLTDYYSGNESKICVDSVKAGNDIILDIEFNITRIKYCINSIAQAVRNGEIDESQIDDSVNRILQKKGYKFVNNRR